MEINVEQAVRLAADACVIAGIIFLALQLRQSNRLLEAQARYSLRQYRSDVTGLRIKCWEPTKNSRRKCSSSLQFGISTQKFFTRIS